MHLFSLSAGYKKCNDINSQDKEKHACFSLLLFCIMIKKNCMFLSLLTVYLRRTEKERGREGEKHMTVLSRSLSAKYKMQ